MSNFMAEIGSLRSYAKSNGVNLKVTPKTRTYIEKQYGRFVGSNGSEYYPTIGKTKVRSTYAKIFLSEHSENPLINLINRIFMYKKESTVASPQKEDFLNIINDYIKNNGL